MQFVRQPITWAQGGLGFWGLGIRFLTFMHRSGITVVGLEIGVQSFGFRD